MANNRQSTNSYLFRIIVTPAVLLCVIFRKQVFQWIAASAIAVWLMIVLISALKRSGGRKKHRHTEKLAKLSADISSDAQPEAETPESELFLIRQINIRITEQLKVTFPMVSWLWVRRPSASEICAGGTWRIQTSNTEPFNYGEVAITKQGRLSITMLQATPLGEASELPEVDNLKPDEMLDRVDVKAWYRDEGERILADMIDDLNAATIMDDEGLEELWERLEKLLTKRELEVLYLRTQGHSYREIARACNLTFKAVAGRLYRLKKKIRKL